MASVQRLRNISPSNEGMMKSIGSPDNNGLEVLSIDWIILVSRMSIIFKFHILKKGLKNRYVFHVYIRFNSIKTVYFSM